jgi:hypothetical protein
VLLSPQQPPLVPTRHEVLRVVGHPVNREQLAGAVVLAPSSDAAPVGGPGPVRARVVSAAVLLDLVHPGPDDAVAGVATVPADHEPRVVVEYDVLAWYVAVARNDPDVVGTAAPVLARLRRERGERGEQERQYRQGPHSAHQGSRELWCLHSRLLRDKRAIGYQARRRRYG